MNYFKLILRCSLLLVACTARTEESDKAQRVISCIEEKMDKKLPECAHMLAFRLAYRDELNPSKNQRNEYLNNNVLCGDASVDKNALVKTIAREMDMPVIRVPAHQFMGSYPAEIFNTLRAIFDSADNITKEFNEPVIILIDAQDAEFSDEEHANLFRAIMHEQKQLSRGNQNVYVVTTTSLDPDKKIFGKYSLKDRFDGNICKISRT